MKVSIGQSKRHGCNEYLVQVYSLAAINPPGGSQSSIKSYWPTSWTHTRHIAWFSHVQYTTLKFLLYQAFTIAFWFNFLKPTTVCHFSLLASAFFGTTESGLFHSELLSLVIPSSQSLSTCFSVSTFWAPGNLRGLVFIGVVSGNMITECFITFIEAITAANVQRVAAYGFSSGWLLTEQSNLSGLNLLQIRVVLWCSWCCQQEHNFLGTSVGFTVADFDCCLPVVWKQ